MPKWIVLTESRGFQQLFLLTAANFGRAVILPETRNKKRDKKAVREKHEDEEENKRDGASEY